MAPRTQELLLELRLGHAGGRRAARRQAADDAFVRRVGEEGDGVARLVQRAFEHHTVDGVEVEVRS